jgi:hypothetical protein
MDSITRASSSEAAIEQFRAEPPYDASPVAFLAGTEPTGSHGARSFSIGGRECRFTSLLLETDSGTYSATAGIVQADQIYPSVESVTADIMDLVFTPKEVRHPRFWLATLHASCSEFAMRRPASHVLAFADRLLYPFQDSERSYAFQPLTYEGESCNVPYDAVMFGEVGSSFDLSSTIAVLPTGILNALGFGLGSAVEMSSIGAPRRRWVHCKARILLDEYRHPTYRHTVLHFLQHGSRIRDIVFSN